MTGGPLGERLFLYLREPHGVDSAKALELLREAAAAFNPGAGRCDDCELVGLPKGNGLADVDRLAERLDPGAVVPMGECPKCGALMYAPDEHAGDYPTAKAWGHIRAALIREIDGIDVGKLDVALTTLRAEMTP